MTNTINTGRTLADNELMNICGGNKDTYHTECDDKCFCFDIGDTVNLYISNMHVNKVRARIVERKWFEGKAVYKMKCLEDVWYSFMVPTWATSLDFE